MPYLNVDLDYFDHRKTKRLIGLLGRGAEVLPIRLWSYCGKFHCENGRLTGYSEQEIESIAAWWGKPGCMLPALRTAQYMDRDTTGVWFMHDWLEHQGHLVAFKVRGKTAADARWKRVRDATSIATSIALSNAPQEVGSVGSVSLPKIGGLGERNIVPQLQAEIGKHFNRKPTDRWNYEEEHHLVEVCKRPSALEEWTEILAYYGLDGSHPRHSVRSVLEHWGEELDKARSYKPDPANGPEVENIAVRQLRREAKGL